MRESFLFFLYAFPLRIINFNYKLLNYVASTLQNCIFDVDFVMVETVIVLTAFP